MDTEQALVRALKTGRDRRTALHEWFFATHTFQRMHTFHQMSGKEDGTTGVDNDFAARGFANIGAWILGRNMFGPLRGPWSNNDWKRWWV